MKFWSLSFLLITFSISLFAQEEEADLWQDEPKALEEEDLLRRESRNQNTLDINTAELEEWLSLPGAAIEFVQAVITYRNTYRFQSIYELQVIVGADLFWLKQNRHRLRCYNKQVDPALKKREILYRIKPDLLGRRGFKENGDMAFQGVPLQQYWRYRDFRGPLDWGISAEQDAGETWNKGPDHLGYFLRYRPGGKLQTLVLGDYQLNLGQGLLTRNTRQVISGALGDGLVNWNGILPVASANEYTYNRGLAAEYRLKNWYFISALSRRRVDGRERTEGGFNLYQTGLHRTENERLFRKRLLEQKVMQRIGFRYQNLQLGANFLYNTLTAGQESSGISLDYKLQNSSIYIYGEAAVRPNQAWEALHGFLFSLRPVDVHWRFNILGKEKRLETYHSSLTLNLSTKQKQMFSLRWIKERTFTPSYRLSIPAEGSSCLLTAPIPKSFGLKGAIRLAYETALRDQNGTREMLKQVDRHTWYRARLAIELFERENSKLDYRLELVQHQSQTSRQNGHLHYLQFKQNAEHIDVFLRYTLYQTDNYDTRLYAYENDHLYVYSIPLFYGQGQRISVLMKSSYKRIGASLKWAMNVLPESIEKGSGADAYSGRYLHHLSLQLRYAW